jgi:uncharacterized protein
MDTKINTKRILIYLAFAFGIPWIAGLGISLSRVMTSNPAQAVALANIFFISTPWLGNITARLITREGWGTLWLRPNFRRGWRFYLAAWLLPVLATVLGGAIFYLVFPQSFDPNLGSMRKLVEGSPSLAAMKPWVIFLSTALSIITISVLINTVVSMGEELGWRAYLLPKLVDRFAGSGSAGGSRKAALLTGLIHGVWHWPLIAMSMSILPGVTFLTPLVYLLFTCSLSVLLSWVTLRSGSVWPAALGHSADNAAAALPGFLLKGLPVSLVGPDPTGLIGGIGYTILALVLLFTRKAFVVEKEVQVQSEGSRAVVGAEIA